MQKIKLNVGCGIGLKKGFVNIDRFMTKEDIINGWKTKEGPFQQSVVELEDDGSYPIFLQNDILDLKVPSKCADYVLLDNVIEHLPMRDLSKAITELKRVLKDGGSICIITPDFNSFCELWMSNVANKVGSFNDWPMFQYLAEVGFGNQCGEGEYHRAPMTPDLLNFLLAGAGFENIQVELHPMNNPTPQYDGCRSEEGSVLRSGTLVARAVVHMPVEDAPSELSICVTDNTKISGGLK